MRSGPVVRAVVAASMAALVLVGCGSGGGETTGTAPPGGLASTFTDAPLQVVATGEATTLADVVAGDRALLLWFWAPH